VVQQWCHCSTCCRTMPSTKPRPHFSTLWVSTNEATANGLAGERDNQNWRCWRGSGITRTGGAGGV
jgi:hypothetical protein